MNDKKGEDICSTYSKGLISLLHKRTFTNNKIKKDKKKEVKKEAKKQRI